MSDNLLPLLLARPLEPAFVAKGPENVMLNVPFNYLTDRFKTIGVNVIATAAKDAKSIITVNEIEPPSLGEILDLPRNENFSVFIPKHQELSGQLVELFIDAPKVDDLYSLAVYARDRVNPYLFNYSLSVAVAHRNDTRKVILPSLIHTFPSKFIDSQVLGGANEESNIVPEESRQILTFPREFTAATFDSEQRLAYFREDFGINLHHWHWHIVFPANGPASVVRKDRRGELFYYMHQQILARYNMERLCNNLGRLERLIDWHLPIKEGYYSKLEINVSSRSWAPRPANLTLQNLNREGQQLYVDIDDLEIWKSRIFEAISSGFVINPTGTRVPLTEKDGIEILANLLEASVLSVNRRYYGNLHNLGHVVIAYITDPDGRHLEPFGIMADTATTMRDPIFYRWHGYIDYIFQTYKNTLLPYTPDQLNNANITISEVKVKTSALSPNELFTFWQESVIDISAGLDFQPKGPLLIRFTHLQHHPFKYLIKVNNNGPAKLGTCRIFLAPKFTESGNEWTFRDQKNLFIALDRFTVSLKQGKNVIVRHSTDSTLTIPFDKTFRDLYPPQNPDGDDFYFCGCGWPHHMLLPKGTAAGFVCHLFVMISNYDDDVVIQDDHSECSDADFFCGIRNKLYPDRRAMGYPFDRPAPRGVFRINDFLYPNMNLQEVIIRFSDYVIQSK